MTDINGQLPRVKISDIAIEVHGGGTPSTKHLEYWKGHIPWITSASLEGFAIYHGEKQISLKGLENSSAKVVPTGNLIVGTRVGVGKAAVTCIDIAINQDLTAVIVNTQKASPQYLAFALYSPECQDYYKAQIRGTTIKGIPREDFLNTPIPLPTLPEQENIATVLSVVQKAKEKAEDVIRATKELKKSMMKHLFTYGPVSIEEAERVQLKETEIGEIPVHWKTAQLREILKDEIKNGAFIKRDEFGSGVPFLNVANTYKNLVVLPKDWERVRCSSEDLRLYSLKVGDLIYVRSSLKREGIGNCCLIEGLEEPCIYDCHLMRVRVDREACMPKYLGYYSVSSKGKTELIRRSKTTTMTTINQKGLGDFIVPLPPMPEQAEAATTLSSIDQKIYTEEAKKSALDTLFKTLLDNLMTGKIRIKDINLKKELEKAGGRKG